ncbi:MAG: anhydro-N-acetylmuramic acid kinase [Nitrospirae bacterium]|nr:anhydro-N-acetylmuramic acid kinase [Nitrospirota bacterium]
MKDNRINRLITIARKKTRTVVGLMSGTSHDGVDAAVARITGSGAASKVSLMAHMHRAYPIRLRRRVADAFSGDTALICGLNFELAEFYADAALDAIADAGLVPTDVDVIGSHGQTVYHIPPAGKRPGSTLQIGDGSVIAARTGIVTVSDFRPADIAAGGHGAPLVPMADWILFRGPGRVTALQNIGGIANVTVVTEGLSGVTGFDTGPGCSLMDEAARILSGGNLSCDIGGNIAADGDVIQQLCKKLLSHPYFRKRPPKSTGRELFGRAMAERVVAEHPGARPRDILRTLTEVTALSIYRAYGDFVLPNHNIDRVVLAGGGALNGFLVSRLRDLFGDIQVSTTGEFGVPVQAREALCFAVLANETVSGNPGNVPAVTGASHGAVLGKISL